MAAIPTDLPVWATASGALKTAPPGAKQAAGWELLSPKEKPPLDYFNWWQNLVYQWIAYFRERSFSAENISILNNQAVAVSIVGALFPPATYRSVKITLSIQGNYSSTEFCSTIEFYAIWNWTTWVVNQVEPVGSEASGLTLSIDNAGQIKYTSINRASFVGAVGSWKAEAILA